MPNSGAPLHGLPEPRVPIPVSGTVTGGSESEGCVRVSLAESTVGPRAHLPRLPEGLGLSRSSRAPQCGQHEPLGSWGTQGQAPH